MSDAFWNYFFASLPGTLAALAAVYASIRNGQKIEAQKAEVVDLKTNVVDLKVKINGQTHELIAAREDVARAVGEIAGKAIGKEQAKADAADLVEAVANKMTADQLLRAEGHASAQLRTRRSDDTKKG